MEDHYEVEENKLKKATDNSLETTPNAALKFGFNRILTKKAIEFKI
jgi:hypothetical protein